MTKHHIPSFLPGRFPFCKPWIIGIAKARIVPFCRRREPWEATNLCGVTVEDVVAGYTDDRVEKDLIDLWDSLKQTVPSTEEFNFSTELSKVQSTEWYHSAKDHRENSLGEVVLFGEDSGLWILHCVAHLCLMRARQEQKVGQSIKFLLPALSVILPVSQFCLNQKIWECSVGNATSNMSIAELHDDKRLFLQDLPSME